MRARMRLPFLEHWIEALRVEMCLHAGMKIE